MCQVMESRVVHGVESTSCHYGCSHAGFMSRAQPCCIFNGYQHQVGTRVFGRDGASGFLKLTLLMYEQLQRFAHLANNETRPGRSEPNYDKWYLVRPTLTHAQSACTRWCTPGTDSAHDEAGFPSRHNWLRKRNVSKPHRYFIEALMCCCSESRFCHTFFINEGQTETILLMNSKEFWYCGNFPWYLLY